MEMHAGWSRAPGEVWNNAVSGAGFGVGFVPDVTGSPGDCEIRGVRTCGRTLIKPV